MKSINSVLKVITALLSMATINEAHASSAPSCHKAPPPPKEVISHGYGVMVDFSSQNQSADQNIAVIGNQAYQFNLASAEAQFNNAWDGNAPTTGCTGSFSDCDSSNSPATPPPPAPLLAQVDLLADSSKCTFLNGGALGSASYMQTVTAPGQNSGGAFSFTYTYNVTPLGATVPALTAWQAIPASTGGGNVAVLLKTNLYGESVTKSSLASVGTKRSFSVRNTDTSNRFSALKLYVDGHAVTTPAASIVENCPGCMVGNSSAVDFNYATNAGASETSSLVINGNARTLLNSDATLANDNGGPDGRALAKVQLADLVLNLSKGSHTVQLKGNFKGVDASANLAFSGVKKITVMAGGGACQ